MSLHNEHLNVIIYIEVIKLLVKCENCSKEVYKKPSQVKRAKRSFCSAKCHNELRHKEKADSKNLNQFKLSWVDDFSLFTIGFTSAAVLIAFMGKQIINLCILVPLLLLTIYIRKVR